MTFIVRNINLVNDPTPINWAANEGWNPGLYDAEAFYATDNKGFFVGYLDNEPISSISAVSYDDGFGFLGFYIVKKKYRDQGYGLKIWNHALKHLPTQNIGLDGVVGQQDNYKKSGFKLAHRNIRHHGIGSKHTSPSTNLVKLSEIPFNQLLEYDQRLFPTSRSTFLSQWIQQPESLAQGFIESDQLKGYSLVRKCRQGFKVGPLFADSPKIANALFRGFLSFAGEKESIFLDTPEHNSEAVQMAESYAMKPVFETARMYTQKVPDTPIHKVFGVTTFELG